MQKPISPSNLCPCSLVYPVTRLLFKSRHSLLNIFGKSKPSIPAGGNHSCSIIPDESLSEEGSQILLEIGGWRVPVGRTQDQRGPRQGLPRWQPHPLPCYSSFIFQLHLCLSANCQTVSSQGETERGMCFLSGALRGISTLSKIVTGSCERKASLRAVKNMRLIR